MCWLMQASECTIVSRMSGIVFNQSADTITDYSQSAKDVDPYFKFQFYVDDPATENWYSFYRMGWVNLKRVTEINFCRWWDSSPELLDRQSNVLPLSYHSSIILLATPSSAPPWRRAPSGIVYFALSLSLSLSLSFFFSLSLSLYVANCTMSVKILNILYYTSIIRFYISL